MKREIRIRVGSVEARAELYDTKAAEAVWRALPFDGKLHTWGDEIYFRIPLKMELEAGQEKVEPGDLGYWPPGMAFCIFFGLTPVSSQGEIRAASEVDVFGKLLDDPALFKTVEESERVYVKRA